MRLEINDIRIVLAWLDLENRCQLFLGFFERQSRLLCWRGHPRLYVTGYPGYLQTGPWPSTISP